MKTDLLIPHSPYLKKKSFLLVEGTMNTFWKLKNLKCKKPLNIFEKMFFFYKNVLDFITLSNIFATHRKYEILSTALVPSAGPSWICTSYFCEFRFGQLYRSSWWIGTVMRIRILDPMPFLTPDSGVRNRFFSGAQISDPESRIPNSYFWELSDNFLRKKFYNSLKIGPNFFLQHSKNKIIFNFMIFIATKKVWQLVFFTPIFDCCFWIRDPRSGIRDG
jgi:hypothetical protein